MNIGFLLLAVQVATPCRDYDAAGSGPDAEFARLNDKGIGVLIFSPASNLPTQQTLNAEISLYAAPSTQSPTVGRFKFASADLSWSYTLETNERGLCSNALEYGYEENGLPVDSVRADRWVRVIYGFGADKRPRLAWAQVVEGKTEVLAWPKHLAEQDLYFLDEENGIAFYDAAAGTPVRFDLQRDRESGRLSYKLHPLRVSGPWMQVQVVTPSDMCSDRESSTREATLWIRFLDQRARPRAWYFTRGC
jgi:hypothetical protein